MGDPLANPIWSTLTGRQAHLAVVHGRARRLDGAYGLFGAVQDTSDESLADLSGLVRGHGDICVLWPGEQPTFPDVMAGAPVLVLQMVAETLKPARPCGHEVLSHDDAPQMRALVQLTEPGPFFERTHELGRFIGVKVDGRLVAMAGERMRPDGHTEVSGVCVHPDHRGHGYAAGLTGAVAEAIVARGERPILHVYPDNAPAIALYERLGFLRSREFVMTALTAA